MRLLALSCVIATTLAASAGATDRIFADIHAQSPSGRFRVDATSPDNEQEGYKAFQARFTYTCLDTASGKTLWTRKQAMHEPMKLSEDSDFEIAFPKEMSPVLVCVSDTGSTVICTATYDLIVVSPSGADLGEIDLLEDALTDEENEQFVHSTTAGPWWTGLSAWYFLQTPTDELFVIRPWWGRRIFVDAKTGKLASGNPSLIESAIEIEKTMVLATMSREKPPAERQVLSEYEAAYLAGVLRIEESIPALRTLEESAYSGSSTSGGLSFDVSFENEVDPHSYSTFTLRQVVQLSLRRLGVPPKPLPCHSFDLVQGDDRSEFVPPARTRSREESVQDVKVGMPAKQVLTLVGSPDFVGYDAWSYDIDADSPFSITLTFDARNVTMIQKEDALWKSGLSRDEALAY